MLLNIMMYFAFLLFFSSTGSPVGVATDSVGNVYIADTTNSVIRKYDNNGTPIAPISWGTTGVPAGVATDSSDNVYVGDTTNNVVRKYSSVGVAYPLTFPTTGAPIGIAVDHLNNVYASNSTTIQKFSSTGTLLNTLNLPMSGVPGGITIDSQNNLYVLDLSNFLVQKYNSAGVAGISWALFDLPRSIAADLYDNITIIADDAGFDDIFYVYDSNGNFITRGTTDTSPCLGVATDIFGNAFMTAFSDNGVLKLVPVVQANPTQVAADGTTKSTITVTFQDLNGFPIVGATASLAANGGSSVISAPSGPSDMNGKVTFTVTDSVNEVVIYTATNESSFNNPVALFHTAQVTFGTQMVQPLPPTNFIGSVLKNKFLTQTDIINVLAWDASASLDVVSYRVYQNGVLVAEVSASGSLTATLHNRLKKGNSYTLVAVNSTGVESTPVALTLP